MILMVLMEPQSCSMAIVIKLINKKELELRIRNASVDYSPDSMMVLAYSRFWMIAGIDPML
jgi:hypothetical protein